MNDVRITIWVSGRPNLDEEPPAAHEKYELINGRLSGLFAKQSWEQAIIKNQVSKLGFPEALRQDKGCTVLRFDWSNPALKDCMAILKSADRRHTWFDQSQGMP